MVLIRRFMLLVLAAIALTTAVAASAHEKHKHGNAAAERTEAASAAAASPGGANQAAASEAMSEHMREMEEKAEEARPATLLGRLMSWSGRMHPFAVHFPIALFPVALIALVLARRRGESVELIRALIIVAAFASVVAAALGWVSAGLPAPDDEAVLILHRWLGTALGIAGAIIGAWAWRRRASVNSSLMVAARGVIVLALMVQGFLGASVTHGMEHMMF